MRVCKFVLMNTRTKTAGQQTGRFFCMTIRLAPAAEAGPSFLKFTVFRLQKKA